MRTARLAFVLLLLAVGLRSARAEDEPKLPGTVVGTARAVFEAHRDGDRKKLDALGQRLAPSAWRVVDELCFRGHHDAAAAYARVAPRPGIEELPQYIEAQRKKEPYRAARKAFREASKALRAKDYDRALEILAPLEILDDVSSVGIEKFRAMVHERARRPVEASGAYWRAAFVAERIGWIRQAMVLSGESAWIDYGRSHWRGAMKGWHYGIEITRRLKDRGNEAIGLGNLGQVYADLGQFTKAIEYTQRGLAVDREVGRPGHIASALMNLGLIHKQLGHYAQALDLYDEALVLRRGTKINDPFGMSSLLSNKANLLGRLGEQDAAIDLLEKAVAIDRQGPDRVREARTLGNLALAYRRQGDQEKALGIVLESIALFEKNDRPSELATALQNLGVIYEAKRELDRAHEAFLRAHQIRQTIGDLRGLASAKGNLADLARKKEQYKTARSLSTEQLDLARDVGVVDLEARALWGLALVDHAEGKHRDAVARAREALELLDRVVGGLSQRAAVAARDSWENLHAAGVRAAVALGDPAELLWFIEKTRAGALIEALGGRAAVQQVTVPPDLLQAEQDARADERFRLAEYRRAKSSGSLARLREARRALDEARRALSVVVSRIQRSSNRAASVAYPVVASLDEIQSGLAAGDTLVLYMLLVDQGYALRIRKTDARIVLLGPTASISEAAEAVLLDEDPFIEPESLPRLRDLVIGPLELGAETKRLFVSTHGKLGFVPFALLETTRELVSAPSATALTLLRADAELRGTKVLAVGDPVYGKDRGRRLAARRRDVGRALGRLPATAKEARAVGDVTLLGPQATEAALRTQLARKSRWRAVHLACHGLLDVENPSMSSLALTPAGGDDGFVTCLDLMRMRCNSDLVTLSACETGKGKIYKIEGVVGLTRAFMLAGSPRVIGSLWKVDDAATQALMIKFYELWHRKPGEGLGAAAALKQAQDFVKSHEKWKHPYYWAAWVLWGLP